MVCKDCKLPRSPSLHKITGRLREVEITMRGVRERWVRGGESEGRIDMCTGYSPPDDMMKKLQLVHLDCC
jgi:hypothetical protein